MCYKCYVLVYEGAKIFKEYITVETEEIKLGLFANDFTGFLKNDNFLKKLLELVEAFGECSGLRIKHDKYEVQLLGNSERFTLRNNTEIKNLKIKHSVNMLGVPWLHTTRVPSKYLVANAFLYKIGDVPSPACSFCGKENEPSNIS